MSVHVPLVISVNSHRRKSILLVYIQHKYDDLAADDEYVDKTLDRVHT